MVIAVQFLGKTLNSHSASLLAGVEILSGPLGNYIDKILGKYATDKRWVLQGGGNFRAPIRFVCLHRSQKLYLATVLPSSTQVDRT